ncbi:hypothetical protein N7468_000776 [Penicillium chermesinum]|uniref:Cytochrome P450 n=1 Tax=Penicillium chermesinum TaxID=63820 RepID=A0A9W9PFB6_9EURO|nr:uncharacterized protein N7468_000776 [Penicillium chermesinum]KAJ5245793.1 hypothetical protein N7468_000776 [Penicillium chermesinum]
MFWTSLALIAVVISCVGDTLLWVAVHAALFLYHLFINPLRHFPGPKCDALSQLIGSYHLVKGDSCKYIAKLHEQYGDAVRTASNELSFTTPTAWQEIYGVKTDWDDVYEKNPILYVLGPQPVSNIFFCPGREHARIRKHIMPAFSGRALHEQESLMRRTLDQLIDALRNRSGKANFPNQDGVVNMAAWSVFQVTDVLTLLALGQSWDTLKTGEYPGFITDLYGTLKDSTKVRAAHRLKPYHLIIKRFVSNDFGTAFLEYFTQAQSAVTNRRAEKASDKKDFIQYVAPGLTDEEMFENLNMLVVAGLDSTAAILSAAIFYITQNPDSYDKLVHEIQSTFKSDEEITIASVSGLRYLKAVIDETMRLHPSVPVGLPRLVPKGGRFIDGYWVPEGTWVSVAQYSAYRSPKYFAKPHQFIPERWTDTTTYATDNHFVFRPFSTGARGCIGKTFAYANIRMALALLLWNFDLKAQPGNIDPDSLKEYGLWEHHPVFVQVKERV